MPYPGQTGEVLGAQPDREIEDAAKGVTILVPHRIFRIVGGVNSGFGPGLQEHVGRSQPVAV